MRFRVVIAFAATLGVIDAAEDPYVEGEVLVTFRQDVPEETARASMNRRSLGFARRFDKIGAGQRRFSALVRERSRSTADLIAELGKDPSVEVAEPNFYRRASIVAPDDTRYGQLWGLENTGQNVNGTVGTSGSDTRFRQAWNLARITGTEPVIAVIDSGVYIEHPDLSGNIWTNPLEIPGNGIDDDNNGLVDDVHGYDFSTDTSRMFDSGLHGTHVSGTIAATGRNATGVIGVQYNAKIIPLKVSTDGTNFDSASIIASCNYVVALKQRGVNIVAVNASYGGGSFSSAERNAIIALRDAGIIFCAASGNSGLNNDTTAHYPSNYEVSNIIAVGAMTQTNTLGSFSNYGMTTVDIAAPGVNIWSTHPLTMPQIARTSSVTVGGTSYSCSNIEYSGLTPLSGITRPVVSCGSGQTAADFPPEVSGNIALIQRGTNTFADKTTRAKAAGAVGAIIYNNVVDNITWTMLSAAPDWLPAVQITLADGQAILASLPATGTLVNHANPLQAYSIQYGTSMACPHVAGAVAFAAWNFPNETMVQRINRIIDNATPVASLAGKIRSGGRLNLLKVIDTDEDGLPDWWETERFGNLARTGAEDTDGDGFTNLSEFLAASDPTSGSSRLAFSDFQPAIGSGENQVTLAFPTVPYRRYQVEWSDTLQPPWTLLGAVVTGNGSLLQVMDTNGAPKRFYRLSLLDD
jgi:subtilisin family serine protease